MEETPGGSADGYMKILYFGPLKDAVGVDSETVAAGEGTTLDQVVKGVKMRHSAKAVADLLAVSALVVNLEYVDDDLTSVTVNESDEVAFIPPVSSG